MIQLTIDTDQLMHNVHFGSLMLGPKRRGLFDVSVFESF